MSAANDAAWPTSGTVVLVPVKSFSHAKARLAPTLGPRQRAELARYMAQTVIRASSPLPVAVVCDDPEVGDWATRMEALVLLEPGQGLNRAVESGVARLAAWGAREVIVVHSDLPLARGLDRLAGFEGVTLVPDRREDGTNVACVPAKAGFRFSYGPGSFHRHVTEANGRGLALRVLREPELAWDVDVPSDIPRGILPVRPS